MTLDQQLFELMLRAPAVPEWFIPVIPTERANEPMVYRREKDIQWPSAYARMVMEAANKGAMNFPHSHNTTVLSEEYFERNEPREVINPMEQSR